ncbi:hypothetical protein [Streptomyces lavendofoliae]|uniref:Peptidase M10 metallopeptidase domain-containing protein n=1 Tax=Streptomyces lavendofoliae TaxID=67314 RepID=A0A918M7T2_9ACTN|nr:hypothetical protein [Streptomyces lavendofoliae]GGU62330.1 hypothetical protein GCM10010274_58880 [Streptomyces lavendofoliae]
MPFLSRRIRLAGILTAVTAALTAVVAAPSPTAAVTTTPTYEGRGWRAWTERGIYSIADEPYTIAFADPAGQSVLTRYYQRIAAHFTEVTGIPMTVTTTLDLTPLGTCPARRRIVVHYSHQPTGARGMSEASPCYQISNGSAWGGHIEIDSEYWTQPAWFSSDPAKNDAYRTNTLAHELGHIMGLAHPNKDLDGDGTVEDHECVATATGTRPLMCFPRGGYYNSVDAGKFTPPFDQPGLQQLAANWYLRQ